MSAHFSNSRQISPFHAACCAFFALLAFAGNSILCRLALGEGSIDAAGFTSIRLSSGALTLALLLKLSAAGPPVQRRGSWIAPAALFIYASAFSFAYLSLQTGTGALILFGTVQLTMISAALLSGERLNTAEAGGILLALAGLIYLVSPGVTAPSLHGTLLMTLAGISWGIYCLKGRNVSDPLAETSRNFSRTLPLVALLSVFSVAHFHFSLPGVLLAVLSGGLASGAGYVVWYAALRGMTATSAATVQLAVPVLASIGGVMLLAEELSLRLIIATVTVLGGVGLAVAGRKGIIRRQAP